MTRDFYNLFLIFHMLTTTQQEGSCVIGINISIKKTWKKPRRRWFRFTRVAVEIDKLPNLYHNMKCFRLVYLMFITQHL